MSWKVALLSSLLLLLGACSGPGARYLGTGNCLPDGSTVWYQLPNAQGSYQGLKYGPQYCKK